MKTIPREVATNVVSSVTELKHQQVFRECLISKSPRHNGNKLSPEAVSYNFCICLCGKNIVSLLLHLYDDPFQSFITIEHFID